NKNPSLDEAVETFMQGAGQISAALLGMVNKVGGQIYALLFLSEEPLSLDDISEKLGVSKSNVSINIRLLEDFKLVRKVWIKGSRRDYYSAERTYPKKVIRDFLERVRGTLKEAITTIERTRSKVARAQLDLKKEEQGQADFMMDQLNLIALFYYAANQYFDDFFTGKPLDIEILRAAVLNNED
ncbi:MAG: MarR family transcriptional regulator, partial [bacterium]|nr:MarR family transcriptional regulator [bacterium]